MNNPYAILQIFIFGLILSFFGSVLVLRKKERRVKFVKRYGPMSLSLFNITLWWWIYLVDFYHLEFYMTFGAGVVAVANIIWLIKEKESKYRDFLILFNTVSFVLYLGFWYYAYQLGKAWNL